MNMGPGGFPSHTSFTDMVSLLLDKPSPTIIFLQDVLAQPERFTRLRAALRRMAPRYVPIINGSGQGLNPSPGPPPHAFTLVTLIHESLSPCPSALRAADLDLPPRAWEALDGRLQLTSLPSHAAHSQTTYLLNVYMPVGTYTLAREAVYDAITSIAVYTRSVGANLIVAGDWNCVHPDLVRTNYADTTFPQDARFARFLDDPIDNAYWVTCPPDARKNRLDRTGSEIAVRSI